ncbi:hypothetical protein [Xylanibacillus composti]|uniref:Uncharacterized protein n=2 Tax=Paenibacillaceae TaxID=186822 RepID=A0A8J4H2D8_9BACL|nr:hypothetical protein [Xylanibacillus composti]GIQ68326.1 hypothetical protein XYCOK13_11500 [Xylanibacillus composti]
MILYLTSNTNVNLLDQLETEQELPVKKLTGQFSLLSFVVKDMRHFSHVRYVTIDRKAVMESDEEMLQALLSFQTMYEIRIIVIAEGLPESSPFLQQLIRAGITNVVTSKSIETMLLEIQDCFSEQGMQRYTHSVSFEPVEATSETNQPDEEKYIFDCKNIRIAIAGSDRRVGVTTTAMNLVFWIQAHGGNACYLEANTSKHLAHIIHLFEPEKSGNSYVIEGANFYLTPEFDRDYNFIVTDCGVLGDPRVQESFIQADIRILCGSAMPYELPMFYRAIERCKDLPVHVIGLFVPESLHSYLLQMIRNDILFGDNSHDLFDSVVNSRIYRLFLKEYTLRYSKSD